MSWGAAMGCCHWDQQGAAKASQNHTQELCYEAQSAGPDPHTSLLLGASTFRYPRIKTPAFPLGTRAAFLCSFHNSGCSKSGLRRAPCSKAVSGTDGIWAQLLGWVDVAPSFGLSTECHGQ